MKKIKYILITLLSFGFLNANYAFKNPETNRAAVEQQQQQAQTSYRMDCAQATAQVDLDVNNVRARLLVGGDIWWDGDDGRYIVPKVAPGLPEVSSIFAGAVWIGGVDPAGNLKLAAKTYGTSTGNSDFWPGPLNPDDGMVDAETCLNWDKHFEVLGSNIDEHIKNYEGAIAAELPYSPDAVPNDVKGWPARGNEFFFTQNNFELPNTEQGLGAFWDENGDGAYNPQFGDYPIIEIRGCPVPQYPDQMFFWIYNDAGNIHSTQGDAIQMEIQVQAFAYATNDELNDMTFMRYKLINRAVETIDSTFFAMWIDPDLGCSEDDYIGCDTTRSMMYVYNQDAVDGSPGDDCPGGVETYGSDVPMLGVDYFRGPLAPKLFNGQTPGPGEQPDTLIELGMTSFNYHNRGVNTPPPQTTDPTNAQQYYNYLTGTWLDGSTITAGGNGVGGNLPTKYMFPDAPNDENGWSMCTANLPFDDRRTIQASGPFRLDPGAVNELIVGVPWIPNVDYPCPDLSRLQRADDLAQNLFDNCFDITDGPDAPDACWVELDRKIIGVLTNDNLTSNNAFEEYIELDVRSTAGPEYTDEEKSYVFEGYKVFQLAGPDVTTGELDDPDRATLVFQTDVKNAVSDLSNWSQVADPTGLTDIYYNHEVRVEGDNEGIAHTFEIDKDAFATGTSEALVNHRKYYFTVIAYAYNDWMTFNNALQLGQERPYLEGRRNIRTYEVVPRPIVAKQINAAYGDGADIIRLDGKGAGGNFLDISDAERDRIFLANEGGDSIDNPSFYNGEITYLPSSAPVEIKIHDPFRVVDGEYVLRFDQEELVDEVAEDLKIGNTGWTLYDASGSNVVASSERTIAAVNEQIFGDLGFSVAVRQTEDAGDLSEIENGVIGQTISYADQAIPWLRALPDGETVEEINTALDYIPTSVDEIYFDEDPTQAYSGFGSGHFQPFTLVDYNIRPQIYITPGWMNSASSIAHQRNPLGDLNNVDIVFTSDKDKWSRCIVVETASEYYYGAMGLGLPTEGDTENFELRSSPSVTKVMESDGSAQIDPDGTTGMGWFPGYAIDVETGQRLNIFFGENTIYRRTVLEDIFGDVNLLEDGNPNGADMMWNPTSQFAINTGNFSIFNALVGAQHHIYVTKQPYDECAFLREKLSQSSVLRKVEAAEQITWAAIPIVDRGFELLSYENGLIPTETVVKVRVDNKYDIAMGTNDNAEFPSYKFKIEGREAAQNETQAEIDSQLDMINVVPNPYNASSLYEISQFSNVVKITNLPAKSVVTIYSLSGQFIRQYNRDEQEVLKTGNNVGFAASQAPASIDWDLKNGAGIPIASGVYLIHVKAEGLGERVIKWFGVNRQFDPNGL